MSRRWLTAWLLIGTVVVALGAVAVIVGLQARTAKSKLTAVSTNIQVLQQALADGDEDAAVLALRGLQVSTEDARDATDGVLWTVAAHTPVVGRNLSAVSTTASVVDTIADDGLSPLVGPDRTLDLAGLAPKDGRIDLDAVSALSTRMETTRTVFAEQGRRIRSIDTDGLLGSVGGEIAQVQDKISSARGVVDALSTTLRLMPDMLGGSGQRTYAVIFQNNAEIRATGGIPGAYVLVTVDRGRITLGEQGSGAGLGQLEQPVAPLTDDEVAVYSTRLGRFFQDINLTPRFSRTAELAQAFFAREDQPLDGVLSVDPVALSYVLAGTGPVAIDDGYTVGPNNVVDTLLNQSYFALRDPVAQDDFFAGAAGDIFSAVVDQPSDPQLFVAGLVRAAREHRLLLWSADAAEQRPIGTSAVGGALPAGTDTRPAIGMYLNDGTGAKMSYYLDFDTAVTRVRCLEDRQEVRLATTLVSNAPADAAQLPESVVGPGYGTDPGSMLVTSRVYLPPGGEIVSATVDGRPAAYEPATESGRTVARIPLILAPLDERRLTVVIRTAAGQTGSPVVSTTPGLRAGTHLRVDSPACG